jgi:hypothetical protein
MEWLSACPMSLGALCGICVLGWEGVRLKDYPFLGTNAF